jgi:KipI family sensor histidine kinase inhibitor
MDEPRILPLGDCALTVEFGRTIDSENHARALGFVTALEAMRDEGLPDGIIEWMPSFSSVTVHFDPCLIEAERLTGILSDLASKGCKASARGLRWNIPVCFDNDFAPDLEGLANVKNLQREDVIGMMVQSGFTVCMLGFLPGFPYMTGLPQALEIQRLPTPRHAVPAGSVAVTGRMCAIYPWESPGGWRLLGRTPLRLFDAVNERRPSLLTAGDEVRFHRIGPAAYEDIEAQIRLGVFDSSTLLSGPED